MENIYELTDLDRGVHAIGRSGVRSAECKAEGSPGWLWSVPTVRAYMATRSGQSWVDGGLFQALLPGRAALEDGAVDPRGGVYVEGGVGTEGGVGGSGGVWAWVGRGYTRSSRMTSARPSDMQARYGVMP